MSVVDSYYFENDKYLDMMEAFFPTDDLSGEVDIDKFSMESIDKIMEYLSEVIANPKQKKTNLGDAIKEKITCLPFMARRQIEKLFDNEDLLIYGHGGRADEIIKSGKMYCKYANLDSHFIPLDNTNESLNKLNRWPHLEASKILIMGLNRREFNPVFQKEGDRYYIPSDYFMGYYDSNLKMFFSNPKFKSRHDYEIGKDFGLEQYPRELGSHARFSEEENFNKVLNNLELIGKILTFSSIVPLDERGLNNVRKQLLFKMNKTYEETVKITPEVISQYKQKRKDKTNLGKSFGESITSFELDQMFSSTEFGNDSDKKAKTN